MGNSPTDPPPLGESKSPKQLNNASPPRQDAQSDAKQSDSSLKQEATSNAAEPTKPLAPPPRPGQNQGSNTPDYFSSQVPGSLSLEPNPFEQSFGGGAPETPAGNKLPPVAALTSPSSLLPGGTGSPFNWGGGSLRTGPLSPAMLSGPAADYFSDTHHLRGSFPTPNESSLRTGLTPGGSGSMFPAPSPNSQALFSLAGGGGATPATLDFHRAAMNAAAAAKREQHMQAGQAPAQAQPPNPQSVTSQPQEAPNGVPPVKSEVKPASGPFDPHDNDAANGLFMLAQGRNGTQPSAQFPVPAAAAAAAAAAVSQVPPVSSVPPAHSHAHAQPSVPSQPMSSSPQMADVNGNGSLGASSTRGVSEAASGMSDESEQPRPNTRSKKNSNNQAAATNGRRKASDTGARPPSSKKSKTHAAAASVSSGAADLDNSDDEKMQQEDSSKQKMTDEEKRRNFLERNRVAALKCRQRKKQWLANLQTKVEVFSHENDQLTAQITALREEIVNLKTLLLAHKDCPVTQQQGLQGAFMQQAMDASFNPQMNPYGMPGPMPNAQVIAGQGVQRRFS